MIMDEVIAFKDHLVIFELHDGIYVTFFPLISSGLKRVKTIDCHDQDEHFTTFEEASYSLWAQSLQPSSFFAPDYNSHVYRFSYSR